MVERYWLALAALGGLLSVAMGAFGAHGVADEQARAWLITGATYLMSHSLAVFAAAHVAQTGGRLARLAPPFFLGGAVVFSGSLLALALGGPRVLGAITPVGGVAFMIGWTILALAALRRRVA